jgi:hypothetical protein
MEPPITAHNAISRDESCVHNWRVSQLKRLGLSGVTGRDLRRPDRLASNRPASAARLPAGLALRIVR